MKILHVITTINRGGAENHLMELICGQRARGHEVEVVYLKGDGYWTQALQRHGAGVHALAISSYGDLAALRRLRRLLRAMQPDVVHAHLPPAELYARLALIGTGGGSVFIISKHNDAAFYRGPGWRALGRWVAARARRVIAISDAVNGYFRKQLGISAERLITVRYGIDPQPYTAFPKRARDAVRAQFGCPASGWLIGTVARLVPQKALHVLLEGFARYRQRASLPSRLLIVGTGPLKDALAARAATLGIGADVVWAGFREDIPAIMAALDVFVLTSAYEGFGLVLLEAMAAGRPVVATRVSAIPEIVVDGVTGILVDRGSASRLAAAFTRLEDASLRRTLGECGRARVSDVFPLDAMVGGTLAVYDQAIKQS